MDYSIANGHLTVTISDRGAEIQSITGRNGTQFFWNGDPAVWPKHGPNLFPYLSALTEGKYTLDGHTYEMGLHGFIPYSQLTPKDICQDRITFTFSADEKTLACYPFHFLYQVEYRLQDNLLQVTYTVINQDERTMYFGIGGHPGFPMPLDPELTFEDYTLTFQPSGSPTRILFADHGAGGVEGEAPYPLEGNCLPLRHDLFDDNAIVLRDAGHTVAISSPKSSKAVHLSFPDMPYVGIWHKPRTEAPFLCIEPWSSLPSRQGIVEDFAHQDNLVSLEAGKTYTNTWSMEFFE